MADKWSDRASYSEKDAPCVAMGNLEAVAGNFHKKGTAHGWQPPLP
jgi:hypothetical protein